MRASERLWTALAVTAIAAVLTLLMASGESPMPIPVTMAFSIVVAGLVVAYFRSRRPLVRIQDLISLGDPDKLLSLVRRRLRYAGTGPNRGPYKIYEATALSMKGDWQRAVAALDEVAIDQLPEPRALWQFGYHSARFCCCVFLEQIDQARAILDGSLIGLARDPAVNEPQDALASCRAMLWFCDEQDDKAMDVFVRLVRNTTIPPPSRAVFHYFIARIYHRRGQWAAADQHFEEAERLAPRTWIPAGIAAFRDSKKLSAG